MLGMQITCPDHTNELIFHPHFTFLFKVASMCACVYFPRMCSLCGRKMLNKEMLKNSEFLRTPADWTPLMQFVVHQDFLCVGFLDAVRQGTR